MAFTASCLPDRFKQNPHGTATHTHIYICYYPTSFVSPAMHKQPVNHRYLYSIEVFHVMQSSSPFTHFRTPHTHANHHRNNWGPIPTVKVCTIYIYLNIYLYNMYTYMIMPNTDINNTFLILYFPSSHCDM